MESVRLAWLPIPARRYLSLVFNMLYLWIFGNAVCEKIGNIKFAVVLLASGIVARAVHNILTAILPWAQAAH